ncbi:hypothetical protein ACWNT8_10875 [Pigmentibacter ruber]|uniref:hypothetical protein n=1 Tax=Pigmentibacter ruber TaxID=2683196 RepID=UPI00131E4187|nr:hypothetical protein [Pigmentibacter ruber]BFD32196.1 hypothetical protein GTC16762_18140 [Pigmentibacter ruber]
MQKCLLIIVTFIFFNFVISCTKVDSVDLIVEVPEMLKKEKLATFYGNDANKNCQHFRKIYAGFCDTVNQPYIKCFDLNEKKYKLTSCE